MNSPRPTGERGKKGEATMFELKHITHEAIPHALEKAERYRLLNEPEEAESICLDILAAHKILAFIHFRPVVAGVALFLASQSP